MVRTEYGMALEMTHGPAAGCASCTEDSTKVEKERRTAEKEKEKEREAAEARQNISDVSKERGRKGERTRRGNGRREKREIG